MATSTTNLNLTKPAVNSAVDEDLWGGQLNTNMDILDSEAALATIDKNFGGNEVYNLSERTNDLGNVSGALAIDYTNGTYQYGTVTGNITSVAISNLPASGSVGFLTLELTQDATGGRTIDLTGGTYRSSGTISLTSAASSIDKLRFETRDGGTLIDVAQNANYTVIT